MLQQKRSPVVTHPRQSRIANPTNDHVAAHRSRMPMLKYARCGPEAERSTGVLFRRLVHRCGGSSERRWLGRAGGRSSAHARSRLDRLQPWGPAGHVTGPGQSLAGRGASSVDGRRPVRGCIRVRDQRRGRAARTPSGSAGPVPGGACRDARWGARRRVAPCSWSDHRRCWTAR